MIGRKSFLTLMTVLLLQGCAIISTGHKVPLEKVNGFKPGETTPEEVIAALGKPENVAENTLEHNIVYAYQWMTDRVIGIGLPPFFMVARKSDNGYQLNIAFAGGVYQGYTLTGLDQYLFAREGRTPKSLIADPTGSLEKTTNEFKNPRKVSIQGYDDTAMEPFISRDGKSLFFNNSNDPAVNTNLFYAKRLDDLHFQFMGEVKGVNSSALDAVASMDDGDHFFLTTTRDYAQTLNSIYSGLFHEGLVTGVRPVAGNFGRKRPGFIIMDVEISPEGKTMYYSDAYFAKGPVPTSSRLGIAYKNAEGAFIIPKNAGDLLHNVESPDLQYAPSSSRNGLELYFTRLSLKNLQTAIYMARRTNTSLPFGEPERISAVTGFVEAPSISGDGKTLYYHKKEGSKYEIYCVVRE